MCTFDIFERALCQLRLKICSSFRIHVQFRVHFHFNWTFEWTIGKERKRAISMRNFLKLGIRIELNIKNVELHFKRVSLFSTQSFIWPSVCDGYHWLEYCYVFSASKLIMQRFGFRFRLRPKLRIAHGDESYMMQCTSKNPQIINKIDRFG